MLSRLRAIPHPQISQINADKKYRVPHALQLTCPRAIRLPELILYPNQPWAEMGKHRLLIPKSLKYYTLFSWIFPSARRFHFF
jgi:hypothetical protein